MEKQTKTKSVLASSSSCQHRLGRGNDALSTMISELDVGLVVVICCILIYKDDRSFFRKQGLGLCRPAPEDLRLKTSRGLDKEISRIF